MRIGVPKEVKANELRVALTPESVATLNAHGHKLFVETGAGQAIGAPDEAYRKHGATIVADEPAVFEAAELIVKVKEPQAHERKMLSESQILFTYLHLAPDWEQTHELLESGCTAIAYETVGTNNLPLLLPMSAIAGRLAVEAGCDCLHSHSGGIGMLAGGVPGVLPANFLIIGAGTVGSNALAMAVGLGANVTIVDTNLQRLVELDEIYKNRIKTVVANPAILEQLARQAHVIIGGVLLPGARAPKLISRQLLSALQPKTVLVDVSIDQGGCFESSKPTTHDEPTYEENDIIHYCVTNMPSAAAKTASYALNNATLPFVLAIADKGWRDAVKEDKALYNGLNIHAGKITNRAVAEAHQKDYTPYQPAN